MANNVEIIIQNLERQIETINKLFVQLESDIRALHFAIEQDRQVNNEKISYVDNQHAAPKINEDESLLTVTDITKILKISKMVVYDLVKQESFPAIKIKSIYRIPKKAFYEWIEKRMNQEKH